LEGVIVRKLEKNPQEWESVQEVATMSEEELKLELRRLQLKQANAGFGEWSSTDGKRLLTIEDRLVEIKDKGYDHFPDKTLEELRTIYRKLHNRQRNAISLAEWTRQDATYYQRVEQSIKAKRGW
jgi:hypothetical protein